MFFVTGGSVAWHRGCCTEGMLRGYVTELDFELVEQMFPGIVRYYRELKEKPLTFLELWWGFTHPGCAFRTATDPPAYPAVEEATRPG